MTAAALNLTAAAGMFTYTTASGQTVSLGPAPVVDAFTGDTGVWIVAGAPWTVNGDQITMDNTDSGNNYLNTIYPLQQSAVEAVTFRVKASGASIVPGLGNNFGIELILTDAGGLGGTILGQATADFPSGTWGDQQFSVTVTPTSAAYYLYAYIFARSGVGQVTVWDAEVFQAGGALAVYGKWESDGVDLWETANAPIVGGSLSLAQVGFYYGDLSNVDNAYSVQHSLDVLSQFPALICNEPGQNTTSRQQYVQQQLIAKGVQLYGYLNVGVGEAAYNGCMPPIATVTAGIDRCATAGYYGVFLDGDGSVGVTTTANNYLYNYAHGKGLKIFSNSIPQDVFTGVDLTTLATPTVAPAASAVANAASTLPAGTYDVVYTYTTYLGETPSSPAASVTIAAGQGIAMNAVPVPVYTLGVNVYLSETAGSPTLVLAQSAYGAASSFTVLPTSAQQPPTTNTASISNPTGLTSALTRGDTCLYESFYSESTNAYAGVAQGGFANVFADYQTAAQLAQQNGVGLCGLAYALSGTAPTDFSDWINAHVLAVGLGFSALAFGSLSSDNVMEWTTPPAFPPLGTKIVTPMEQTSSTTYDAVSDAGIVRFVAVDSPVSRSIAPFASVTPTITIASSPTASAALFSTSYEQSPDNVNWTAVSLGVVTDRYVRQVLRLHS